MQNSIAQALSRRGQAIGTWVQSMSPDACEIAGSCGYDFVILDLEHGTIGWDGLLQMVRAVDCTPASAIVRLPDDSPTGIKKVLDSGALGVLIPNIRTADEAAAVVRAARFHPLGNRGACPMIRAACHGVVAWQDYAAWSNQNVQVWATIETCEAVENIEEILQTGVNAIVLGIFDLSMALGLNGEHDHPRVRSALEKVLASATRHKVDAVAVNFEMEPEATAEFCRVWKDQGCRIFTGLMDRTYLRVAYQKVASGFYLAERAEASKTQAGSGSISG